jgi:transcriptional regulator with XRE-family HTH domain
MPEQKIKTDTEVMKAKMSAILKRAREIANVSQGQLADMLETTQSSISTTESGQNLVNLITLDRWMQACGAEVHFVVTKKGETLQGLGLKER